MKYRSLGTSGLQVSEVALGSWLTLAGGVQADRAAECVRAAYEAGVTFFDTANSYGRGAAEQFLGRALAGYPRDSYVLATKVFMPMADDHPGGLSAHEIGAQLDASLQRLGTDHLDLYQCHRFDPDTPIEETAEALSAAVESGKVRTLGFSEWLPDQIAAGAQALAPLTFASSQVQYSMLWRGPEREVFPACTQLGISQILWSPLAQGVLTGKYLPGAPPPAGSRGADPSMSGPLTNGENRFLQPDVLAAVQRLHPIAADLGATVAQLALAWALHRREVASVITGASRPEQVRDNIAATELSLGEGELAAIDEALGTAAEREPHLAFRQRPGVLHRRQQALGTSELR